MMTTIPTAIPPPKLPPLNLDFVVVVLGLGVVDVAWDVVMVHEENEILDFAIS
jgi:hypothetical protein